MKLFKDVRLNKLDISGFKIITSNDNLIINWVSNFISRPKSCNIYTVTVIFFILFI